MASEGFEMDLREEPRISDGGDDEFDGHAHYAQTHGLVEAMIHGWHVIALCGHRFIPMRDPAKYPICPACKAIHDWLEE